MPNTIRIKRRTSGATGAPSSLKSGELAYNNMDNTVYAGFGDDGSGNATSVKPVGGEGAFAKLDSPALTGTPTAPTATADTTTTQVATTAFVAGQAASATPVMDGSATVGVSKKFAREDHVHPSDTSKANLASPALTGTPTAPTASNGTNTTQIATTAFVQATRLDQFAAPTAAVAMNSQKITNLADPVSAQDAATKAYVDAIQQGLDVKGSVRVATTASLTLTAPGTTIDGVAMVAGDRVLVKDQATASQNGIYVWNGSAVAMSRAADANTSAKVTSGLFAFVEDGLVNSDSGWIITTNNPITLDTTALTFAQFSGAGQVTAGAGLTKTGNQIDIASVSSSRIVVNADSIDLATTGITAGTYTGLTIDAYGRATAGTTNGLTDASIVDGGTF